VVIPGPAATKPSARFPGAAPPLQLDVTDREAVFAAVDHAVQRFGRIDVVVNNAGYGHFGMVEEVTERELREHLETNFFGAVWVTQAVLQLVDSDAPPARLVLGRVLPAIEAVYQERLRTWRDWQEVSEAAFGSEVPAGTAT
jgi:NAD(P)-dependent dehydrogenase (short-subunit alcohol dehydrogenase family)